MRKLKKIVCIGVAVSIMLSSIITAFAASGTTTNTKAPLNLRSGPGTNYRIVCKIPPRSGVETTGNSKNGFSEVNYKGKKGWISNDYLSVSSGSKSSNSQTAYTTNSKVSLNLRANPSTSSSVVAKIPPYSTITVYGSSSNGWYRATYNGKTGFVSSEYVSFKAPSKSSSGSSSGSFSALQSKYPHGSYWNGSYDNRAWQCHGWALTIGRAYAGSDPYTWKKVYNLNNLKAGDIIRFGNPHTIVVTGVSGDTIYYADCNGRRDNIVRWNQSIGRNSMTSKWGKLQYVMVSPR